ncbi:MAG TPA: hypothetical protein VK842_05740 [bacterium]|jgi:hypothetical protein|nr:hypothetical protein [bacterium]
MEDLGSMLCAQCGAGQEERPLMEAIFAGQRIHLCLACMPGACQGLDWPRLAENLRERRSRALESVEAPR